MGFAGKWPRKFRSVAKRCRRLIAKIGNSIPRALHLHGRHGIPSRQTIRFRSVGNGAKTLAGSVKLQLVHRLPSPTSQHTVSHKKWGIEVCSHAEWLWPCNSTGLSRHPRKQYAQVVSENPKCFTQLVAGKRNLLFLKIFRI